MTGNFAELVDGAAQHLGLNDYQLSAAIGLLEGNRVYSPKQVHRLRAGEVRHPDPELVERLVIVLHLDPNEAFAAARVLPHGFEPEHFRRLEFFATTANGVKAPKLRHDPALVELIDRNRRRPTLELVAA